MENMHSFTNLSLNKDKFFPLTRIVKNSNHTDGWEIKGKTNINHLSLCNKKNNRGINPSKWYSRRALPHRATVCHVSVLFYSGFSFNLSPVFMFECFFSFMDLVSDVKVWRFSLFAVVWQDWWSPLVIGLPSLLRIWNQHTQLHSLCKHRALTRLTSRHVTGQPVKHNQRVVVKSRVEWLWGK